MTLVIKKGLDVPIAANPKRILPALLKPTFISLNLDTFQNLKFTLLVDIGDQVKIGTPIVENKQIPNQFFVSPASGVITEIRRGAKRALIDIVIKLDDQEMYQEFDILPREASKEEILDYFLRTGMFAHIHKRPFNRIADPKRSPRAIFVKAIESLPFVPPPEMQIEGQEIAFELGLETLKKLTTGLVYLICRENSSLSSYADQIGIEKQIVSGPHPSGNASVHIHHISPIINVEDLVWTLNASDVVILGNMMKNGRYYTKKVVGIGGEGIDEEKRGFVLTRMGISLTDLLGPPKKDVRWISGDPLTGQEVNSSDFLKFKDFACCAILKNFEREPLHFLGLGRTKFSMHRAYITGHVKPPAEGFSFTTNQHGEERPFIDGSVYDKVMPMKIPTMPLIRAILAEDFELAEQLGFLEVIPEDFALPSFICPSKIDMMDIVQKGINAYSREMDS